MHSLKDDSQKASVDVTAIIKLVDTALADYANRSLVSSEEFMNVLLDIRCNIHMIDVVGEDSDTHGANSGKRKEHNALDGEGGVYRAD